MGRRAEPVEEVAGEIGGLALIGDSAAPADADASVAAVTGAYGGLDILVANAGGDGSAAALDTDDATWDASVRSNLTSSFVLARAALPRSSSAPAASSSCRRWRASSPSLTTRATRRPSTASWGSPGRWPATTGRAASG